MNSLPLSNTKLALKTGFLGFYNELKYGNISLTSLRIIATSHIVLLFFSFPECIFSYINLCSETPALSPTFVQNNG